MDLKDLVEQLASALKIDGLSLDENRMAAITVDELKITLEGTPLDDAVLFYSVIAALPEGGRETFYETLLEAQLFFREMGEGCCLGVDVAAAEVVICRKLSLDGIDAEHFQSALNEFANWADHWKAKLAAEAPAPTVEDRFSFPGATGFIRA